MDGIKNIFTNLGQNRRQYGILIALVLIVIAGTVWTGGRLIMPQNLVALVQQNAYVIIMALGMLMIIVAGHIDLSVGSVVGFVGAVMGVMMYTWHWNWVLATILGLVVGILVGCWQGFWISIVGIPAFIVTLAGQLMFRGLAIILIGAYNMQVPQPFQAIANGSISNIFGFWPNPFKSAGIWPTVLGFNSLDGVTVIIGVIAIIGFIYGELRNRVNKVKNGLPVSSKGAMIARFVVVAIVIAFLTVLIAQSSGGMPWVLIIVGALVIAYTVVVNRSVFGRHTYAIGGNLVAAILSGVNAKKVNFYLFVSMGFLAAVAAVVTTSRLGTATTTAGTGFELDVIAACFVGGTAVQGGVGRVQGVVIGALIMGTLNMSMNIMSIDPNWQMVVKGMVLLLAVALDLVGKNKGQIGAAGRF